MPKAPRYCPGDQGHCTNLITHERYCPDHQPLAWQGPRTASSRTTSTYAWQKLRIAVLRRDRYQCQTHGPHCIGHATEVDHPNNVAAGGPPVDPSNAKAICQPCHKAKTQREAHPMTTR